jgi:predicted GNAT family N-acyltransferase
MTDFTLLETTGSRDASALGFVRHAVFIEEQGVPEALEWDAYDANALHVLASTIDGHPIGCARLLPGGQIGRMAVLPQWRGLGVGRALLAAVIAAARSRGDDRLTLSAQTQAVAFYRAAGFDVVGDAYEDAGIPHVAMQKSLR